MTDSLGKPVAVIETTGVEIARVADVDLPFAIPGARVLGSVSEWRAAHEEFWHGPEMRKALGDPAVVVSDDTRVILERFRLVQASG